MPDIRVIEQRSRSRAPSESVSLRLRGTSGGRDQIRVNWPNLGRATRWTTGLPASGKLPPSAVPAPHPTSRHPQRCPWRRCRRPPLRTTRRSRPRASPLSKRLQRMRPSVPRTRSARPPTATGRRRTTSTEPAIAASLVENVILLDQQGLVISAAQCLDHVPSASRWSKSSSPSGVNANPAPSWPTRPVARSSFRR